MATDKADKNIDKIVKTSKKNPIQALILVLLIGISTLGGVVSFLYYQQSSTLKKANVECSTERKELIVTINNLNLTLEKKDSVHKAEILVLMNGYNQELKEQVNKQEAINQKNQELILNNARTLRNLNAGQ